MVTFNSLLKADLEAIVQYFKISGIPNKTTKPILRKFIQNNVPSENLNNYLEKKFGISKPKTQKSTFKITEKMYDDLVQRISILEQNFSKLPLNSTSALDSSSTEIELSPRMLLDSLKTIIRKNPSGNRWIPLDLFFDNLMIYREARRKYDKILLEMYYAEKIELAEGSNSSYRIRVRGMEFGRITLRS